MSRKEIPSMSEEKRKHLAAAQKTGSEFITQCCKTQPASPYDILEAAQRLSSGILSSRQSARTSDSLDRMLGTALRDISSTEDELTQEDRNAFSDVLTGLAALISPEWKAWYLSKDTDATVPGEKSLLFRYILAVTKRLGLSPESVFSSNEYPERQNTLLGTSPSASARLQNHKPAEKQNTSQHR